MARVYTPGSIVVANYLDVQGKYNTGFFCVLYDEQIDPVCSFKSNVIALKITTSYNMMMTNHAIPVSNDNNTFFDRECMALCSRPYVIDKSRILELKGYLDPKTFGQVYRGYKRFESELERQTEDYIY